MELFKSSNERLSPSKQMNGVPELRAPSFGSWQPLGDPVPNDLAAIQTRKRKTPPPPSEDNPFNDRGKTRRENEEALNGSESGLKNIASNTNLSAATMTTTHSIQSPFIRSHNLTKILNQTFMAPSQSSSDPGAGAMGADKTLRPPVTETDPVPEATTQSVVEEEKPKVEEEEEEVEEDEVTLEVLEEMSKLEKCFPELGIHYRLIDKIGEGTFSTVYKAECVTGTIRLATEVWKSPPLKKAKNRKPPKQKNALVALKQIYVTSSPNRIHNELNLLYMLSGNSHVAPLLDVLRYQDQVLAILPYYQHADFRDFYRDLPIKGIKKYLWEMFHALEFIHDKGVIHRDLKPTNFLYDPFKGRGVLVDFGLAEKEVKSSLKLSNACPCKSTEKVLINRNVSKRQNIKGAYPKQDQRPPRRANRAGTRGFRAPEVLFKCTNQTTKIDIWSAGTIALSLITRKFPLFHSPDDTDAIVEMACIFGTDMLKKCAELHGCGLELNLTDSEIPSSCNLIKVIHEFVSHEFQMDSLPPDTVVKDTLDLFNEEGDKFRKPMHHEGDDYEQFKVQLDNYNDHKFFMDVLSASLQSNPSKRMSAKEILTLPFFEEVNNEKEDVVLL